MALESISGLLNSILLLFVVLGFGAIAGYFCERVGIVNIAIDGQMIFGALIFSIFGMIFNQAFPTTGGLLMIVPLILSMLCSVLLSSLFGYMVVKIQSSHVVSGTAINLAVTGLATFLTVPLGSAISGGAIPKLQVGFDPQWRVEGVLGENSQFYVETIVIFAIAIIVIVFVIFMMNKTRFGLRFKAIGDNPNAVDAQGVNVNRNKWIGVILSGIFAAVAGSIFVYGGATMYAQSTYFEGNVGGLGFLALAILVSGAWKPSAVTLSALVFAALVTVFGRFELFVNPDILNAYLTPYYQYLLKAVPFALSLVALGLFSWKGSAPKAVGLHFDRSAR